MLNRRGFLKGIMGAVALIAAAPALRVLDAVIPGPPPPQPKLKVPSHEQKAVVVTRYQADIKALPTEGLPSGTITYYSADKPVPDGWVVFDGREIPKGTYARLELAMCAGGRFGRYPYGETLTTFKVPDLRGATGVWP